MTAPVQGADAPGPFFFYFPPNSADQVELLPRVGIGGGDARPSFQRLGRLHKQIDIARIAGGVRVIPQSSS